MPGLRTAMAYAADTTLHGCGGLRQRFAAHAVAIAAALALSASALARPPEFLSPSLRARDFDAFCRFVAEQYAYFDVKSVDWPRTCRRLAPFARSARDRAAYIDVLEQALRQLYDSHAHLGTNTAHSPRLVPSQTSVMARWIEGRAVVTDVRRESDAERAGVRESDVIVSIDGAATAEAARAFEPQDLTRNDPAARDWALLVALAGRHERKQVRLVLESAAGAARVVMFEPSPPRPPARIGAAMIDGIAHLRLHDSLGDPGLIRDFDDALDRMRDASAVILDLRDTPSGGTSTVARGILGRFVDEVRPYQRHELVEEYRSTGIRRIWVEHVASRGVPDRRAVVVLVGRWTGSMGEGMAIGLNAARGAPVAGRRMAGLLGALGEIALPHSKIVVRIPVEKLFHVDGSPREAFEPCEGSADRAAADQLQDRDLAAAVALAKRLADAATTGGHPPESVRCN